jgi:hypothetical protein
VKVSVRVFIDPDGEVVDLAMDDDVNVTFRRVGGDLCDTEFG